MLDRVRPLDKCSVTASDGVIGPVKKVVFDDIRRTIRDPVVDTGHRFSGHHGD